MKLILTNYIASLKEDKELDVLIQDILREYNIEIVFGPQRGRQYGVDIYAVGEDPDDGVRKVLLITVKQGNLDRKNRQGSVQSIQPSLAEIATVFVRNNLLPEHRTLPIKIILAHNGYNEAPVQQNFVAFTEQYSQYAFAIWQLETLVNFVQDKLINEYIFSDNSRKLLRKVIINLYNPDYDLADFSQLLDEITSQFKADISNKKQNIKLIRKINLINAIAISYCEEEDDLRLAFKVSEITLLRLWDFQTQNRDILDGDYVAEIIQTLFTRQKLTEKYIQKISPICEIKDGFSRYCRDSIAYSYIAYEHIGFLSVAGLETIQLGEFFASSDPEFAKNLIDQANMFANTVVNLFNNNGVVFSPRVDNNIIEINLAFILLHKLNRKSNICGLLIQYLNQIASAKIFANVFPNFSNSIDEVYELDHDFEKRKLDKLSSSQLLTNLIEWAVVVDDKSIYDAYVDLKNKLFKEVHLVLWFPDFETEKAMFKMNAMANTGYTLSNIIAADSFEEFKQIILDENEHNCTEAEFVAFKQGMWTVGLIASRHYRTYVFPNYWRQFIAEQTVV